MRKLEYIMGMPVIVDPGDDDVFDYFRYVDEKFSPYKQNSEVTKFNDGRLREENASWDMKLILRLSDETKKSTDGYFDIELDEFINPSGIVKGWAIYNASKLLSQMGFKNFYLAAGGDIQTKGISSKEEKWTIGIRNPFDVNENIKVVYLSGEGIATSGIYERGKHIYNPKGKIDSEVVSISVIGPNVYEADRFATAAFAMGKEGINFIEKQKDLEGYMIDRKGIATMTSGFFKYTEE